MAKKRKRQPYVYISEELNRLIEDARKRMRPVPTKKAAVDHFIRVGLGIEKPTPREEGG